MSSLLSHWRVRAICFEQAVKIDWVCFDTIEPVCRLLPVVEGILQLALDCSRLVGRLERSSLGPKPRLLFRKISLEIDNSTANLHSYSEVQGQRRKEQDPPITRSSGERKGFQNLTSDL